MIFVAVASHDYITLSALGAFLANNVTAIVKSQGDLFIQACSSLGYKKLERPILFEVYSIVMFMAGILLVTISVDLCNFIGLLIGGSHDSSLNEQLYEFIHSFSQQFHTSTLKSLILW